MLVGNIATVPREGSGEQVLFSLDLGARVWGGGGGEEEGRGGEEGDGLDC